MRIVQMVLSLDIGGQERLVARIVRALHQRGHDVHVVTLSEGRALASELGDVPIHQVHFRGANMERFGFDPFLHARLYRLFEEIRPNVIHTHNTAPLAYAAPAARLARISKVVHTKHGNFKYSPRALPIVRFATRFVSDFVAVSDETARAAEKNERPRPKALHVIENGIPLDSFKRDAVARIAVRDELGLPHDAVVVGTVGRLVGEKDYPLLVRAMKPLLSERVRLVFVGEGKARAEIEKAIDPEVRKFVVLAGARRDVPRVLASFDVFAMSSRTEGLPLALPEAMTATLPVVATAVGGVPGIVPAQTGFLVPHGDPEALRAPIARLIEDRDLRDRMGEAARAYALGRFSEDRMIAQYLDVYAQP